MSTIVDKLRDRAYATKAGDPLCEEAAALIEGLEWRSKVHANVIARLSAEVERLRDGAVQSRETVQSDAKPAPIAYQKNDENSAFCDTNREARIDALERLSALDQELERKRAATCPHVRGTVTQHCSLNFTLTDAEREAIATAADLLIGSKPGAILRKLLERPS